MYSIGFLIGLLIFGLLLGIDKNKKPKFYKRKTYYIKDGRCYGLDNQLLKVLSLTWDEYFEGKANLDRTDVYIHIIN